MMGDAYDIALQDRQAVDMHRSAKNREAEMDAIDRTQDHHTQTLMEHDVRDASFIP